MTTPAYYKLDYWNQRYASEKHFEWCLGYSSFKLHFEMEVPYKKARILILGCGNSSLGNDLSANGYTNVLNSDYSDVLISKMNHDYPNLKWIVADINKLEEYFSYESFDIILEKATLDSFFVKEKDPWHYNSEILTKMDRILFQVSRMLVKGGKFISLSFTQPHFRKPIYAKSEFNWSFNYSTYGDYFHYFFYVMTKGRTLDSAWINEAVSVSHFLEPLSEDEEDFIFSIQSA